jgi:hypothetical protein
MARFQARCVLSAALAVATALAFGVPNQKPTTPAPGSADRKAIMDALRPAFEKHVGKPVVFVVQSLRVVSPWALASFEPRRTATKPIDWKKTKFKEDFEQGVMDSISLALLKKSGKKWKVVELAIGPTDYPVEDWLKHHKAPKSLIPRG